MNIRIILEVVAMVLAVSGLLLQPKKNPAEPSSWKNLSVAGRIILVLIVLAAVLKLVQSRKDSESQQMVREMQKKEIDSLQKTNNYLVKAISVSTGYNARIHGVVTFNYPSSDAQIRAALKNLFLKFAAVDLLAVNEYGEFHGRVDYGAHPEVYLYRSLLSMGDDSSLLPADLNLSAEDQRLSYYFDVRCAQLKILNSDKIEYVKFRNDQPVSAKITTWPNALRDFQSLYGIKYLRVYKVDLEELGSIPVSQMTDERN